MGEGIAVALRSSGAGEVTVVNRTPERGDALAQRVNGVALGFDRLHDVLATTDVAITCTGSGVPIVTADVLGTARLGAGERPLLLVDIAVPRDVAADVAELPGVSLLDLDDLAAWADLRRTIETGRSAFARGLRPDSSSNKVRCLRRTSWCDWRAGSAPKGLP